MPCLISVDFHLALEFALGEVQGSEEGLEVDGIRQFVAYDENVPLLQKSINAIDRNIGTQLNYTNAKSWGARRTGYVHTAVDYTEYIS